MSSQTVTFSIGCQTVLLSVLIAFTLLNQSCKREGPPESIAVEFIDRVDSAVESRSIRELNDLISTDYHDASNRDHRDIAGLASAYLIRTKSLHLFTDLRSAQLVSGTSLHCTVLAAFAATPVSKKSLLPDINADFYWFDLDLVKEKNKWKVASSVWKQAMIEDFFNDEGGL